MYLAIVDTHYNLFGHYPVVSCHNYYLPPYECSLYQHGPRDTLAPYRAPLTAGYYLSEMRSLIATVDLHR